MDDERAGVNQNGMITRSGHSIVELLARGDVTHGDYLLDMTMFVEEHDVSSAFQNVKGLALIKMTVRSNVGFLREDDKHFMQKIGVPRVSAEADPSARG